MELHAEYMTGNQGQKALEFGDADLDFIEFFNITEDNWQMNNLWKKGATPAKPQGAVQAKLHEKLHNWFNCRGADCP